MENIIYKTKYSDQKCLYAMQVQEDEISNYIDNSNSNNRRVESNVLKNFQSFDRKIDQVIGSMKIGDTLIISHINMLGQSTHRILKRLLFLLHNKLCSLYVITRDIRIRPNDFYVPIELLVQMSEFSNALNGQKQEAVKNTLKSSGKKTGRVKGKKYKSKFDEYRTKIMTMHSRGISKKRICETIGIGTPQAIGKYIKAVNEEREKKQNKQKKDKTYISTGMIDSQKLSGQISFENINQQ